MIIMNIFNVHNLTQSCTYNLLTKTRETINQNVHYRDHHVTVNRTTTLATGDGVAQLVERQTRDPMT